MIHFRQNTSKALVKIIYLLNYSVDLGKVKLTILTLQPTLIYA